MKKFIPLLIFLVILLFLWRGLHLTPTEVASPLINKPAPNFALPNLLSEDKVITNKDLIGHVTLLNVWATWCYACAEEHENLLALARDHHIILYGLNYKDDVHAAKKWLEKNGNPYTLTLVDANGNTAIDFGVYGTPETFVIDKKGVIRYKQIGPISADVWDQKLKPIIEKLNGEQP